MWPTQDAGLLTTGLPLSLQGSQTLLPPSSISMPPWPPHTTLEEDPEYSPTHLSSSERRTTRQDWGPILPDKAGEAQDEEAVPTGQKQTGQRICFPMSRLTTDTAIHCPALSLVLWACFLLNPLEGFPKGGWVGRADLSWAGVSRSSPRSRHIQA